MLLEKELLKNPPDLQIYHKVFFFITKNIQQIQNKLFIMLSPFTHYYIRRYTQDKIYHMFHEDFFQESYLPFLDAFYNHSFEKETSFIHYYSFWLRAALRRYYLSYREAISPNNKTICSKKPPSIVVNCEQNLLTLLQDRAGAVEFDLSSLEQKEQLAYTNSLLSLLLPKEEYILRKRFGIGCEKIATSELASSFSISRERLHQIEKRLLDKLRKFIDADIVIGDKTSGVMYKQVMGIV